MTSPYTMGEGSDDLQERPFGQPAGQASPRAADASRPFGDHQAQWTPGPWVAGRNANYVYQEDDGLAICGIGIEPGVHRGEANVANARLIAAAPELFEALKEAAAEIEELRRYANNHGGMIDNERCEYARAALNKALGK